MTGADEENPENTRAKHAFDGSVDFFGCGEESGLTGCANSSILPAMMSDTNVTHHVAQG
jgi:hypothetical protein